jgi:hypothetical protein
MGIKLAPQPLIQFAVETSGLNDFGGHTFEAGLDALIHSLNTDIDLEEGTAGYFRQMISQLLLVRLPKRYRIDSDMTLQPSIHFFPSP